MVDTSQSSSAFGVLCNAAFEEVYRENMAEGRGKGGCEVCVDVGHEPMCSARAWGGDRPKPETPNVIIADEHYPWLCTRRPGHDGAHVGCTMDNHDIIRWPEEESLRSSKSLAVTVSKMVEIYDYPMKGKFVRRPRLDLISQPGDITMLPVVGVQPNPNGTWLIKALTPWEDCHIMGFDCPQSIYETLPNTRFCEGDLMSRKKDNDLLQGIKYLKEIYARDAGENCPHDFYEGIAEVAETLSELHPIENSNLQTFFGTIVLIMTGYEEAHGMACD